MFCFFLQHVATHSHSHPLAISNFIWAGSPGMPNEIHIFFFQIRCSHGSHEPSTMDQISHTRSLALSLLIFYMLNRVLHREQNSRIPQMPSRTGIPRLARWLSWSRKFRPGWPPGPGWCLHRSERQTSKRSINTARTVSRRGVRVKTIASRCSWARDHQQLSKESGST